jgi:hypothetical protein
VALGLPAGGGGPFARGDPDVTHGIKVTLEDTNAEVLARIAKAAAKKFNCSLTIDFHDGNRTIEFVGDESCKPAIAREVENIFRKP